MNRKLFLLASALLVLRVVGSHAQTPGKLPKFDQTATASNAD